MTWGVMILHRPVIGYCSFVMADDKFYADMERDIKKDYGPLGLVYGKTKIEDKEIDGLCKKINSLIKRLNDGDSLNIEAELKVA